MVAKSRPRGSTPSGRQVRDVLLKEGKKIRNQQGVKVGDIITLLDPEDVLFLQRNLIELNATQIVVFNKTLASMTFQSVRRNPESALHKALNAAFVTRQHIPKHSPARDLTSSVKRLPNETAASILEAYAQLPLEQRKAIDEYLAVARKFRPGSKEAQAKPAAPVASRDISDAFTYSASKTELFLRLLSSFAGWISGSVVAKAVLQVITVMIGLYGGKFLLYLLYQYGFINTWLATLWGVSDIAIGAEILQKSVKPSIDVLSSLIEVVGWVPSSFWSALGNLPGKVAAPVAGLFSLAFGRLRARAG